MGTFTCPSGRCVISEFNGDNLKSPFPLCSRTGIRTRSGKTKGKRDGIDNREEGVWRPEQATTVKKKEQLQVVEERVESATEPEKRKDGW